MLRSSSDETNAARKGNEAMNFAIIRRFVLSLLRKKPAAAEEKGRRRGGN